MSGNVTHILVEAEDRACQQERLRHVVEQPSRNIGDLDHLIRHECNAAHDEQHRTGILRDFEAIVVFHGIRRLEQTAASGTEEETDDVTDHLEYFLKCFVHNFLMF